MSFDHAVDAAAARYAVAGRFAQGMARGKLRGDPAYRQVLALLGEQPLPAGATLVDLGCGEGYLLALVSELHPGLRLVGIDHDAGRVDLGRRALGAAVDWQVGDARELELPRAQLVVVLDVLHYLPEAEQDALVARLCASLEPGGTLLIREAEAGAGWRSTLTAWSEGLMVALGRHKGGGVHLRTRAELAASMEAGGLTVEASSCSEGTPFANVLYLGRRLR